MIRTLSLKSFFICVSACSLLSCTMPYTLSVADQAFSDVHLSSQYVLERNAEWIVHTKTPVFLAQALDVAPKTRNRHRHVLYLTLEESLQQAFPALSSNGLHQALDKALQSAKLSRSELLFVPKLTIIENNLGSHHELVEGKKLHPDKKLGTDRAVFQVYIYDVNTSKLIDVATISSRNSLLFSSKGQAIDLLPSATYFFVSAISGKSLG